MFKKKDLKLDDYSLFPLNLKDSEVPQGICKVGSLILVSCYKITGKSIVIIYENGIRLKEITLTNKSHVGGIGYDDENSLLFISDINGRVSSYNFLDFINGNLKSRKIFNINIKNSSYLTIYNNELFVGTFNKFKRGFISVYDIKKSKLDFKYQFKVPNKIQGLTFYLKNDIEYLLLSKSFGRKNKSKILIYKFNKKSKKYLHSIKLPPMLEQISVVDNKLLLLFESGACIYKETCRKTIEDVLSLDINKII